MTLLDTKSGEAFMPLPTHYVTLGVGIDAAAAEIKQAFRRLAFRHSPDFSPSLDAERQFGKIMAAYEILGKPAKRAEYDSQLFEDMFTANGQAAPQSPQWAREGADKAAADKAAADAKAYADAIAAVNAKAARIRATKIRATKAQSAAVMGFAVPCTPTEAAAIMGLNFIGINDVEMHFGIQYTAKQLSLLNVVPFSVQELQECADTHILIPGCGLTIGEMFGATDYILVSKHFNIYSGYRFHGDCGYYGSVYANPAGRRVPVGWHLVRKSPLPNTFLQSWDNQQARFIPPWTIPPASLMVQTALSHYLLTGVHLLSDVYARTSSIYGNRRVSVGIFDADGLSFSYLEGTPISNVGVAEAHMSNQSYRR